jgi:hypothetical protein
MLIDVNVLWFPENGTCDSQQPITARISEHGRCFFGRNAAALKDICGVDEIGG